ncbi:MAG: Holliday junction resolvase, partial [Pyrobaculum sp.]
IVVENEKIDKLLDFAKRAGGEAFLLVKYGRNPWRVLKAVERVGREDYEKAIELRAFLETFFSQKIDQYF